MAINQQQIDELRRRDEITTEDVAEFLRNPKWWRRLFTNKDTQVFWQSVYDENAQTFWQGVYDELAMQIGGSIIVPPEPKLTAKQRKSLDKFGFMLVYIPAFQ